MKSHPKKAPSRPLYLDEKSGKPTRYNVYLEDLTEAINGSRDMPHMMKYLIDKGYEIDFTGAHWKMKLPQYGHFTRLDTLDERLTPEFIRSHLGTRARYGNYKARISYSPYMPEQYKKAWRPHQKTTGILALYYYWCYQLGIFPKGTDYKPTSPLMKQELREHRRRPTKSGIVSMFSGLLYCADCGEKLHYSVTNNYKREQAYFFCSSYRKNSEVCSAHYIREKVVSEIVLDSMQRVFWYVQSFEKQFARKQMDAFGEEKKKELSEKRRELSKAKKRVKEIDNLIQKIYEDNVIGKISDERFATMSMAFEEEQQKLKSAIPEMEAYIESETDKSDSLQRFIDKVQRVTQLTELTPEIAHEFIEKIVVSKPEYRDGKRYQNLEIYYNGVGIVREPTPEEMEELFQEHLKNRKSEKTA